MHIKKCSENAHRFRAINEISLLELNLAKQKLTKVAVIIASTSIVEQK